MCLNNNGDAQMNDLVFLMSASDRREDKMINAIVEACGQDPIFDDVEYDDPSPLPAIQCGDTVCFDINGRTVYAQVVTTTADTDECSIRVEPEFISLVGSEYTLHDLTRLELFQSVNDMSDCVEGEQ
jgi:hypothetical protein